MLLVAFQDTDLGRVVGTVFHTLGAVGLLGGFVAYVAWSRGMAQKNANGSVLRLAKGLTWGSAAMTLSGGFMRTFQEGHPGFDALSYSPWVQVMVIKHLFLFGGIGAMLWLVHRHAPRMLRLAEEKQLHKAPFLAPQLASYLAVAGIVVAGLLGALSQITSLGVVEVLSQDDPQAVFDERVLLRFSGSLTSLAGMSAQETGSFEVPNDSASMEAVLTWSDPAAVLSLHLEPPQGEERSFQGQASRAGGTTAEPEQGRWNYRVTGENAADVEWNLRVTIHPHVEAVTSHLAETIMIPPDQFFEINTQMPRGAAIVWDWQAQNGAQLHFDLHSHFDGEVQEYVAGEFTRHRGDYHTEQAGGYSLLWHNTSDGPITIRYQAWGDFTVDSYYPPR